MAALAGGCTHPFIVITDHKNLQYLRDAKRLNPRQARWALFFTRFNFTITYRPGNCNCKADALSRLHSPESPSEPEPIFPALIVSPIQWDISENIRVATLTEPAPLGGPEGKTYVPTSQRQPLLGSVHDIPGSGHPGSRQTLSLLQAWFWWPSMTRDVIRYVCSCSVCAMSKTPRHFPVGKLVPLPVPRRPWSHIGIDFVTDLPNSDGNTCVLVTVDRFSKACKFIPLKGLPTAFETAECLFNHVFRNFGLPEEIVSDRGPTSTAGAASSPWPSTPRTLSFKTPPDWLPSNAHSVTNPRSSRGRESPRRFQLWTTGSERESVGLDSHPSSARCEEAQDFRRYPSLQHPNIPARGEGVVVHPGSAPPPAV